MKAAVLWRCSFFALSHNSPKGGNYINGVGRMTAALRALKLFVGSCAGMRRLDREWLAEAAAAAAPDFFSRLYPTPGDGLTIKSRPDLSF